MRVRWRASPSSGVIDLAAERDAGQGNGQGRRRLRASMPVGQCDFVGARRKKWSRKKRRNVRGRRPEGEDRRGAGAWRNERDLDRAGCSLDQRVRQGGEDGVRLLNRARWTYGRMAEEGSTSAMDERVRNGQVKVGQRSIPMWEGQPVDISSSQLPLPNAVPRNGPPTPNNGSRRRHTGGRRAAPRAAAVPVATPRGPASPAPCPGSARSRLARRLDQLLDPPSGASARQFWPHGAPSIVIARCTAVDSISASLFLCRRQHRWLQRFDDLGYPGPGIVWLPSIRCLLAAAVIFSVGLFAVRFIDTAGRPRKSSAALVPHGQERQQNSILRRRDARQDRRDRHAGIDA